MTQYTFTQEQRAAFRKAITSHVSWDFYRTMKNLSASNLSIEDMLTAAKEMQPEINPADYGTVKGFHPRGLPKPKPYGPEVLQYLEERISALRGFMTSKAIMKASEITHTIVVKQNSYMTEGQYQALLGIIASAEASRDGQPSPDFPQKTQPEEIPTMPQPASQPMPSDAAAALQVLISSLSGQQQGQITEARIIELIKAHAGKPAHITVDLKTSEGWKTKENMICHYRTPLLLSAVSAGVNVMLVGPAGSGKTTAAEQISEILGLPFYFTGAISSEFKLTGFIDAQGRIVSTAFRQAYEHGGVFLFDEMDASMPAAVLAFNAALANGQSDFPDGTIKRHKDFRAIAATNTFGRGADRQYVGRLQLDAASLDRFATLSWDYDSGLEAALIGQPRPEGAKQPASITALQDDSQIQAMASEWLRDVLKIRAKAEELKLRHIVSPRSTINGVKLLAAGWPRPEVEEALIWKGLDTESRTKIIQAL